MTRTDTLLAAGDKYRVYVRQWSGGDSIDLYLVTTLYGRAVWRVWDKQPGALCRALDLAEITARLTTADGMEGGGMMGNAPAEYPPNRYMLDWDGSHPSRTYKVVDVNTGETVFTSSDSLKAMAESYRRNAEVGFGTGRPKSTQAKTDAA